MAVAERELSPPAVASPEDAPRPWLCSFEQFQQMGEARVFDGQRVELWNGKVLQMPAMSSAHAVAVTLAGQALRGLFGSGHVVREQLPFHAAHNTDPEPDIAVVSGTARDYVQAHPTQAALLMEVSLSTLEHDRIDKSSLYASAGILDYWIINLEEGQLEVHRNPASDATLPFKFGYADVQVYKADQSVAPLAVPDVPVAVADLLP